MRPISYRPTIVAAASDDPTTEAAARMALSGATRRWRFRYEVIGPDDGVKGHLETTDASVANDHLADGPKRTTKFTVLPGGPTVNYLRDRVRIWALLRIPGPARYPETNLYPQTGDLYPGHGGDGWHQWCLGTFHLTTTTGKQGHIDRPTDVEGYDSLLVLEEDKVASRHHVPGGTRYRQAVVALLESAGFTKWRIPASTLTAPGKGEEWPPGTSKLEIVNDLLEAIGYTPLVMDPLGVPVSGEYVRPRDDVVTYSYQVDERSVLRPGIEATIDLHSIPNRWVAWVSEPDRPLIRSVVTNRDPASILSTVRRGRVITEVLNAPKKLPERRKKQKYRRHRAATQRVLDNYVERVAEQASSTYEHLEFATGLMPFHGSGDVYLVNWGQGDVRWQETSWEMELRPGGTMKHKARRVVPL